MWSNKEADFFPGMGHDMFKNSRKNAKKNEAGESAAISENVPATFTILFLISSMTNFAKLVAHSKSCIILSFICVHVQSTIV